MTGGRDRFWRFTLPEYYALHQLQWQIFGTLTFNCEVSEGRRMRMVRALFRHAAKSIRRHPNKLFWTLREEGGDRRNDIHPHLHFLFVGIPERAVRVKWCQSLQDFWSDKMGAVSQIEPYDATRGDGLAYILKRSEETSGLWRQDSATFGHPNKLMLSHALEAFLKRRSRRF